MTNPARPDVRRILRFSLTSANAAKLSGFYEHAFGFQCLSKRRHAGAEIQRLMGVPGGATSFTLKLGREEVELVEYDIAGQPYPADATSADLTFQHLALVVANMETAYQRLLSVRGWTPISTAAPQHLPETSGNVTAFKFRDPEGHPLELLAFPTTRTPTPWHAAGRQELFLGVDHTAISVRNTALSLAFYRGLGLCVSAQTVNLGPEQQRLDGLSCPELDVTALELPDQGPHLELLCYRFQTHSRACELKNNDIAAARTVFEMAAADSPGSPTRADRSLRDPDGHHIQLICRDTSEEAPAPLRWT